MDKQKLDYFYKVVLIILFVGCIVFLGSRLQNFTLDGRDCMGDPYIWGSKKIIENSDFNEISCNCIFVNKYGIEEKKYFSTNIKKRLNQSYSNIIFPVIINENKTTK